MFLRHIQCRWLTLVPALQRILKNWKAVCKYFLTDLPAISKENHTESSLRKNSRYRRICTQLQGKETLAEIQFLTNTGPVFESFLELFQKQEPLIHLLYSESADLLKTIMLRFMKYDTVGNCKGGRQLLAVDVRKLESCVDVSEMEIGSDTKKSLSSLEQGNAKKVLMGMRSFYQTVAEYLQKNLPLHSYLMKGAQCLHPEVKDQEAAQKYLKILCSSLPSVSDENMSAINDEWKMYRSEEVPKSVVYDVEGNVKRIDSYWDHVLSIRSKAGGLKYPQLTKIVQTCLAIAHGNADVERSLSVNKKLLTPERTCLSEESLNGLRLCRDVVNMIGKVTDVPVTKELLSSTRQAHRKYAERKEAEKMEILMKEKKSAEDKLNRQKEKESLQKEQDRKRKLNEKEKDVKKSEKELQDDLQRANEIFEEANERLAAAIKAKDFKELNIAQSLLEVARANIKKVTSSIETCKEQRDEIARKRKRMIDGCLSKQNTRLDKEDA